MKIAIKDIRIDGGTQIRERIDEDTVADYAEKLAGGETFPPVDVFSDGSDNWLADGFHRVLAHERANVFEIECNVRKGTKRDAILFACGANSLHGLRRSNADKRRSVLTLLEDPEWSKWSNVEIAKKCGVSDETVRNHRSSLPNFGSEKTYITKHGTTAKMNTANIGRKHSAPDAIECKFCGQVRPNDPGRCPWCKDEAAVAEPVAESEITDDGEPLVETVEAIDPKPSPESLIEPGGCTVDDLNALVSAGKKFACIYADPAWQYGNQATRASTDNHYPTMALDDICAIPVAELAAENAHLHLWTTNGFLFDAKRVMEAWGFEYKSVMVWVKPQMGIGNYWRVSHEFMLFGIRGKCPFLNRGQKSWHAADRGAHSAKPDEFRRKIELVSPGPRLELFGRKPVEGWTVWGNQISRTMFDLAEAV